MRAKVCCRSLGSAPRSADTGLSQAGPEKARQNRPKQSSRAKSLGSERAERCNTAVAFLPAGRRSAFSARSGLMVTRHDPAVSAFGVTGREQGSTHEVRRRSAIAPLLLPLSLSAPRCAQAPHATAACAKDYSHPLFLGAREAPHATPPRARSSTARPLVSVRAKRRTPRPSVREGVQPHARKQDERKVLEDQITICQ